MGSIIKGVFMNFGLMVTDKFIYQTEVDLSDNSHMVNHMGKVFIMLKMVQ